MTPPEWLTQRGGTLKRGSDGSTWYVIFDGKPNYALNAVPVAGEFGCQVKQTINGRRLDSAASYAGADAAIAGGLEDLRKVLGW
jgi:hypothetical protein